MKKIKLIFIALPTICLTSLVWAQSDTLKFDTIPVKAKHADFFWGTLPQLRGTEFTVLNHHLHKQLYRDFDHESARIEMETKKIYQDDQYLSFEIFLQISDLTSRYKSIYYTIDIKQKQVINLATYLKQKQLSQQQLNQALFEYTQPCYQDYAPEYCEDMSFHSIFDTTQQDQNYFKVPNVRSFYLKKDILGLNFESNKFTYAFEYDLKTNQIR